MKIQTITYLAILFSLLTFQNSSAQQRVEIEGNTWVKDKLEININGANNGEFIWNPTGLDLRFYTNSLERMVVTNDGSIDTKTNKITNLGNPTEAKDAVTKAYVDNILLSFGRSIGPEGIQGLLDAGFSPIDIISNGADTSDLIGLTYEGGIIFYIIADGTGLVAAPVDQGLAKWGCVTIDLPTVPNVPSPPTGSGAEIGDGIYNTTNILNDCVTAPAALACDTSTVGGFSDWFLPSILELDEMYNKIGPAATGTNQNIGGFALDFYWSSSEINGFDAWTQRFDNGNQSNVTKNATYRVRAIRAF